MIFLNNEIFSLTSTEEPKKPVEKTKGNDENKSPTNKRRSNRIKLDAKPVEKSKDEVIEKEALVEKEITKESVEDIEKPKDISESNKEPDKPIETEKPLEKENVEKEILSDEDIPLSITKATLVAENSKDASNLLPTKSKPKKPSKNTSKPEPLNIIENSKKKEVVKEEPQSLELKKAENDEKKKSKKKIQKEPPQKKSGRGKKSVEPLEKPDLNKKDKEITAEKELVSPPVEEASPETIAKPLPEVSDENLEKVSEELKNVSDDKETQESNKVSVESHQLPPEDDTVSDKKDDEVNVMTETISSTTETEKIVEISETISTEKQVKKKRKRRKNELAAIVADQLLESFKEVDKSRIDDLKMLENLAYEKSEDLLLTGE